MEIETGLPLVPCTNRESRGPLISIDSDQHDQLHVSANGCKTKASWIESARGEYHKATIAMDITTQFKQIGGGAAWNLRRIYFWFGIVTGRVMNLASHKLALHPRSSNYQAFADLASTD